MVFSKNNKSESKYTCIHCDFHTSNICHYNKHILTPKHVKKENDNQKSSKTESNNIQSEPYHKTSNATDMNGTNATVYNENDHSKSQISQMSQKYTCTICNYHTKNQYDYNKHLHTSKHIKNEKDTRSSKTDPVYTCTCGKTYKYNTGYYRHKKNCTHVPEIVSQSTQDPPPPQAQPALTLSSEPNFVEIIQVLVKENQEIRNFMVAQHNSLIEQNKRLSDDNSKLSQQNTAIVEQNKTLTEVVKTLQPANNSYNTTTNNNNQTYTINMFLNEKCKDAQNFSKFIEELKPKVDMLKIYENGYVDGISKLFIDGLSSMEITERPLHCTDERRNTFYVHDNDEWNKDENLKLTKHAIFNISQENMKQCVAWSNNIPPNVDRHDHITQSVKLCKVAWSGDDKNTDKIIKNISKEIPLNKQVINDA